MGERECSGGVRGAELQPLLSLDNSIWNNFIVFTFDFYKNTGRGSRGGAQWVGCIPGTCSARKVHVEQQRINSTRQQQQQQRANERTTKSLGNVYISSCWQGVKGARVRVVGRKGPTLGVGGRCAPGSDERLAEPGKSPPRRERERKYGRNTQ